MRIHALLLLAALPACAGPAAHRAARTGLEPGTLVTADERPIPLATWAAALDARYVLVGEGHDQACDHRVQAAIVRALASRHPVVGLEMVSTERQPVLDRFDAGEIAPADLGAALSWQEKWGVPYALYAPIFDEAHAAGLDVAALNVPADVVRDVSREGEAALPEGLPPLVPPPPEQLAFLRESYDAHAHANGSEEGFARFVRVQSLWDTAMAHEAQQWSAREGAPVVVLAGAGHVLHGWGIAHRLRRLDPGATVVSVVPWRGDAPIDPAEGDFFFYCPADG